MTEREVLALLLGWFMGTGGIMFTLWFYAVRDR